MGLISKTVIVKWNSANREWYEFKGYIFSKWKEEFEVKVEDLSNGSNTLVNIKCNNPNCENPYLEPTKWNVYK